MRNLQQLHPFELTSSRLAHLHRINVTFILTRLCPILNQLGGVAPSKGRIPQLRPLNRLLFELPFMPPRQQDIQVINAEDASLVNLILVKCLWGNCVSSDPFIKLTKAATEYDDQQNKQNQYYGCRSKAMMMTNFTHLRCPPLARYNTYSIKVVMCVSRLYPIHCKKY